MQDDELRKLGVQRVTGKKRFYSIGLRDIRQFGGELRAQLFERRGEVRLQFEARLGERRVGIGSLGGR